MSSINIIGRLLKITILSLGLVVVSAPLQAGGLDYQMQQVLNKFDVSKTGYKQSGNAFSFERANASITTERVNIVSFSPPRFNSGCGGIGFDLGNFSILTRDEAVSLLRTIAAQSLTYAFGQAISALCSKCATALNTLKEQINKFNQFSKNSCNIAKTLVDKLSIEENTKEFVDDFCRGSADDNGEDSFECSAVPDSLEFLEEKAENLNNLVGASGGDVKSTYTGASVLYEVYTKIQGAEGSTKLDNTFPDDVIQALFGADLEPYEVAWTLFGGKTILKDPANDDVTYKNVEPLIPIISSLIDQKIDSTTCSGESCPSYYKCVTTTNTQTGAEEPCGNLNTQSVSITLEACTWPGQATTEPTKTILDTYACNFANTLTNLRNGEIVGADISALTTVDLIILNSLTIAEQRALIFSDKDNFTKMSNVLTNDVATAIAKRAFINQLTLIVNTHNEIIEAARRNITNISKHLNKNDTAAIVGQISDIRKDLKGQFAEYRTNQVYWNIVNTWSRSLSQEVSSTSSNISNK